MKLQICNLLCRQMFVRATIYPPSHSSCAAQEGTEMDDELSVTLDLIVAGLDARPTTSWSLAEARRVLAALPGSGPSGPTEPVLNLLSCIAAPRLNRVRRRLGA